MSKFGKKISDFVYKHFSMIEHLLFHTGIIEKNIDRQPYHIGWLAEDKTLEDLRFYLHSEWGFGNHFVSFTDKGQIINWRKLEPDGRQYHVRVYNDGEIRGHLEFTPEQHPMDHLSAKGEEEAKIAFLRFFGDFIVYKKHISQLKADPAWHNPPAEIIKEENPSGQS